MAVANFQYITRMSSGFKVYILEGQPHHRSEDRFRNIQNEPHRGPSGYPGKRKRSLERGLTLEERRERALSRTLAKAAEKETQVACTSNSPQSPSSTTWSPASSPTSPVPPHVYYAPIMDEPLALIKKPRKDPEISQEKPKSSTTPIQMRPSVITCVSSLRTATSRPHIHKPLLSVSQSQCDRVVDEHFQRSLGESYQRVSRSQQHLSISVSVDDHFAKALGDKWQQIKSKSSSCSSTPPSSPSVTHSPSYSSSSPYQSHKEPSSSSRWSIH